MSMTMNMDIVRIHREVKKNPTDGYDVDVWATMRNRHFPLVWTKVAKFHSWSATPEDAQRKDIEMRQRIYRRFNC